MLVLRAPSRVDRALGALKVLLPAGLVWSLSTGALLVGASPDAPVERLAAWAVPPLGLLVLLALLWRRSAAARRALEAGAVTTLSGHRLLPPRFADEPVLVLAARGLDVGQAAREYAAQVHVPRGDRESLDLGRCERVPDAPARFTLEVTTALRGREVLVFDCAPLLAATGARPSSAKRA